MHDDIFRARLETEISNANWPKYGLFGLTLASNFSFANRLVSETGQPNLTFTCVKQRPPVADLDQTKSISTTIFRTGNGQPLLSLTQQPDYDLLQFSDVAHFYIGSKDIVGYLFEPKYDFLIEIYLLGIVLSCWLERQGIPALHASAVIVDGQTAVFLASNTGGKTSLAATLMQAGFPLLTDDILPVDHLNGSFLGRPGYPQMRMWPDQAQYFLGRYRTLDQVHPALSKRRIDVGTDQGLGTFCNRLQPLTCFYLPERQDPKKAGSKIEITPVAPARAVIELIRHSFVAHIVEAMGLQAERLGLLVRMAEKIPLRRLVYPHGNEYLPAVREAILTDLARLQNSSR